MSFWRRLGIEKVLVSILLVVLAAMAALFLTYALTRPVTAPVVEEQTCITQKTAFQSEFGLLYIGESVLCGTDLHISFTAGPDWESWARDMRARVQTYRDCYWGDLPREVCDGLVGQ